MDRIFLGGTCAETTWRDELIEGLKHYDCEWFNPVVKNWTPDCQAVEEDEKNNKCNIHLYTITPEMKGVYSIAEIINSCWQAQVYGTKVKHVVFCVMGEWDKGQKKSFDATMRLCKDIAPNRCTCCYANSVVDILDAMVNDGLISLKIDDTSDIPETLEEAFVILDNELTVDEKHFLISGGAVASHFTIGTWIRNTWNMWGDNSPIKDYVVKKTELLHPDEISNYILEEYIKYLNNK